MRPVHTHTQRRITAPPQDSGAPDVARELREDTPPRVRHPRVSPAPATLPVCTYDQPTFRHPCKPARRKRNKPLVLTGQGDQRQYIRIRRVTAKFESSLQLLASRRSPEPVPTAIPEVPTMSTREPDDRSPRLCTSTRALLPLSGFCFSGVSTHAIRITINAGREDTVKKKATRLYGK